MLGLYTTVPSNQRMLSSVLDLSATVTPYAVSDAAGFEPTPFLFKKKLEVTLNFTTDLLRGLDSNQRPQGYEPCELPLLPPRNFMLSRKDSNLNSLDQNQMCCRYTTGQFAISNMSKNSVCYWITLLLY